MLLEVISLDLDMESTQGEIKTLEGAREIAQWLGALAPAEDLGLILRTLVAAHSHLRLHFQGI